MHRELKKLLRQAKGESAKVVAMFVDVRGFTSFAGLAESTDAADYLKSVYIRTLDGYLHDCDYFKLTGDGMMVIYHFDEANLQVTLRDTVKKSLGLVKAFPTLTKNDAMINFDVPTRLGIGLARGSATVIKSGSKTLDYTGRTLNLAARLMDIARPAGVVFDEDFGIALLTPATQKLFTRASVYINGVAEETPLNIYHQTGVATISGHRKLPITAPVDQIEPVETATLKTLRERGQRYQHPLKQEPSTSQALVYVRYPKPTRGGRRHPTSKYVPTFKAKVIKSLNHWYAELDYAAVAKHLEQKGCKDGWPVEIIVEYQVRAQRES